MGGNEPVTNYMKNKVYIISERGYIYNEKELPSRTVKYERIPGFVYQYMDAFKYPKWYFLHHLKYILGEVKTNRYENRCYLEDEARITENKKHNYIQNAGNVTIRDSNTTKTAASSESLEIGSRVNEEWSGKYEFLLACIATSVGLGNVWRFPFTAYENGGGAFLIPYIIVLFLIGKPFYYLEALLGQFTNRCCSETWEMVPAMRGLGYGHVIAGFTVLSYYCALMALTLYYFVSSFQAELPWSYCREEWKNDCLNKTNNINTNAKSAAELYFRIGRQY